MSELPEYTIKKSKRKTLSIYIERDGSISVLAPENKSDTEIEEVVKKKSFQIFRFLAEKEELNASRSTREPVSGETYTYLGRNYQLQLVEGQDVPLMLKEGHFLLSKKHRNDIQEVFKDFYRKKGLLKIKKRVDFYKEKMGVSPAEIRVMELKNRWASCNKKGDLNFHWKCMMAPLSIIDYIIVHELAHLRHDNHSEAFWNEVDKVMPDYRERKNWLKFKGAGMDL
ncbi:SprT family zinc-dependent metalloprotease [Cytophagaceae bacterium ABcell3]|nr:SprT family zinc-dependent metalloprotease [Cytophagaceae bacterium ABcell3]